MRNLAFALIGGMALPAAAQDLSVSEWATLPRVLDATCVELVADSAGCEMVFLLASEGLPEEADLVILPNSATEGPPEPLEVARGVAYAGRFFGQRPELAVSRDGRLILREEQTAIGRTPWTQDISIAHQGGAFVVVAQSWSAYDRPAGGGFSCVVEYDDRRWQVTADRVNPESGETTYDVSESGRLAPAWPILGRWRRDRPLPAPCAEALEAWFSASPM